MRAGELPIVTESVETTSKRIATKYTFTRGLHAISLVTKSAVIYAFTRGLHAIISFSHEIATLLHACVILPKSTHPFNPAQLTVAPRVCTSVLFIFMLAT